MENNKNDFKAFLSWKNLFWVVLVVLVLFIAIGGLFGRKYHQDTVEQLAEDRKKSNDSLIELSKVEQKRLHDIIDQSGEVIEQYKTKSSIIEAQNKQLHYEINKQKLAISRINDTSFRNNARVITESVRRYYETNDTIR